MSAIDSEPQIAHLRRALVGVAHSMHAGGHAPATSGNYSARIDADRIVITRSGIDKGALKESDFLLVDRDGTPLTPGTPSAETLLHALVYRQVPAAACVLHSHSARAVVLSRLLPGRRLSLEGWELLKAFSGVTSHAARIRVPIYDNDQDMAQLAAQIESDLFTAPVARQDRDRVHHCFGFLLRGHGLYTWGDSIDSAARHLEAFDYLFGCELEMRRARG